MARVILTESDVLAELARVGPAPEDARTMLELADATGYSRAKVQQEIGRLHRAGRVVVHRVTRQRLDGNFQVVPAYTIRPKAKK
jgi:hypothetical protein